MVCSKAKVTSAPFAEMRGNMKAKIYALLTVLCVVAVGVYYYAMFPAINIHDMSFWTGLLMLLLVCGVLFALRGLREYRKVSGSTIRIEHRGRIAWKKLSVLSKIFFALAALTMVVIVIGSLMSSKIFRARSYASLLKVEESDFSQDLEPSERVSNIALMDTASARIFGDRKIGSLSQVVSQFEVESDYTQINIKGVPQKVAALRYASFFKWWNNRSSCVPGYVQVNPVNSEAKYISLDPGMRYLPSGYFNDNLQRHVQFRYPTKIFSGYYFEVDDEGNPYYVCPSLTARIGLFGAMDVCGAVLCNPIDGSCKYYPVDEIPSWVDRVFDGDLLIRKYNWYGILSGGYINSIIGQKGCRKTTDDYGYKTIGDDVWVYTGVTSVAGDQSNIGFVLMNQRTSEAKYYTVSGAEEHSAMASAEGEVQEKGYQASFPSLINVDGVPTYIMVLKDAAGLVKMYAMVNVEQYNLVATANTQSEVFSNYKKLLAVSGQQEPGELQAEEKQIVVSDIQYIDTEDGTVVYLKDEEHVVYKQAFSENESLIKIAVGDTIRVTYEPMEDNIHFLISYDFVP